MYHLTIKPSKKQTRSVWKTYCNVNKWWLYNRKFIRLFVVQNYYKFFGIVLSRETNMSIPHQINFVGRLQEDDGTTMFFTA